MMGRLFMDPLSCPFQGLTSWFAKHKLGKNVDAVILDFHAETTSEKMAFGHHCDGRASLVLGTHTHVPTADAQILPNGTAYQTDVGMCGDFDLRHRHEKRKLGPQIHHEDAVWPV